MIGKITGGSISSLTASCTTNVELGSFVVIHDGARKFWGTITELSHPQVPAELVSMPLTGSRFQPEAAINLKRMSTAGSDPLPVLYGESVKGNSKNCKLCNRLGCVLLCPSWSV